MIWCGDFNAHSTLWGNRNGANGIVIEEIMETKNLVCLNVLGSGGSAAMCHGFIVYVCCHALAVFVVFNIDGRVFMLSGVMHIRNVVSSLFGCFRV